MIIIAAAGYVVRVEKSHALFHAFHITYLRCISLQNRAS